MLTVYRTNTSISSPHIILDKNDNIRRNEAIKSQLEG